MSKETALSLVAFRLLGADFFTSFHFSFFVMTSGIDYGHKTTNIDSETGIRYGVIHNNRLASHAWDEITSKGTDLDYKDGIEGLTQDLTNSLIRSVLADYDSGFDCRQAAEEIVEQLDLNLESTGDCTRYQYYDKDVTFTVCSDGDIFVTKSKFYALCGFCSPCAPGAGHLESDGEVMTYCLGPDWFDSDNPMPYSCFSVENNKKVA